MPLRESLRSYSETDLQNARTKGQVVGWVQGGLVVGGGLVVLSLLGWIPLVLIVLVVAVVVWKLMRR